MFPDGMLWVNIGIGDESRDMHVGNLNDIYTKPPQMVNYQPVDWSKYNYEVYLYEKPFFNMPYMFIALVMEHKTKPVFEYIRPDGAYWQVKVALVSLSQNESSPRASGFLSSREFLSS